MEYLGRFKKKTAITSDSMQVVMIGIRHHVDDSRIYHKESLSLKEKGYRVTIIGMPKVTPKNIQVDRVIEVDGSIIRRILLAILFGIREQADVYHVHDMESLVVGMFLKVLNPRSKLIWDVHEYYPDMIPLSNFAGKLFLFLMCFVIEPVLSRYFVDLIITADETTASRYIEWNSKVFVVYNYVEFNTRGLDLDASLDVKMNKNKKLAHPIFVYVGGISISRGSDVFCTLAEIISEFGGSLLLVGPVKDNISKKNVHCKNTIYFGKLPHEQIPLILKGSQVGIIPHKPVPKYHKNIPIKLFEYITFGLPVISSKLKATCEFTIRDNIGECIDYYDSGSIRQAIFKILSEYPKYRKNCLRASKKYYWKVAAYTLVKAYRVGGMNNGMDQTS